MADSRVFASSARPSDRRARTTSWNVVACDFEPDQQLLQGVGAGPGPVAVAAQLEVELAVGGLAPDPVRSVEASVVLPVPGASWTTTIFDWPCTGSTGSAPPVGTP
ncbi:hypothetical protein [Streptomyces sp. XY332]|uniref:hypothetical protein n=1 Tax=Streptomyces sp. XY332 TaxID=1415561 RepID=UPI00131CB700|nr:hypothetical protein [Streptomyces sp. XY332]